MTHKNFCLRLNTQRCSNLFISGSPFKRFVFATLLSVFTSIALASTASLKKLEDSLSTINTSNEKGQQSQSRIDTLDNETDSLLAEFKQTLLEIDQLKANIDHLQRTQIQQKSRLQELNTQLNEITQTETAIIPLLIAMIDALESSIKHSLPFHQEERQARIHKLRHSLDTPDLDLPEKYRQVLDAYEIERDFAYTLEAYQDDIQLDDTEKTMKVTLLRVGSIAWYYQSADQQDLGHWNKATGAWEALNLRYASAIKQGIDMAYERTSPDLIKLPLQVTIKGEQ